MIRITYVTQDSLLNLYLSSSYVRLTKSFKCKSNLAKAYLFEKKSWLWHESHLKPKLTMGFPTFHTFLSKSQRIVSMHAKPGSFMVRMTLATGLVVLEGIQGRRWLPSWKGGGIMALGCKPAQKVNNVQEGFAGYLSNKSCSHEHFVLCLRVPHNSFSVLYKLSQFLLPLFQFNVPPSFLQM